MLNLRNSSSLFLLLIAIFFPKTFSESVTCEGDIFKNEGNCINTRGTASDPLDEYICNGNNNQCYCGYTKNCICKNNNGNCNCEHATICNCNNNDGNCIGGNSEKVNCNGTTRIFIIIDTIYS